MALRNDQSLVGQGIAKESYGGGEGVIAAHVECNDNTDPTTTGAHHAGTYPIHVTWGCHVTCLLWINE